MLIVPVARRELPFTWLRTWLVVSEALGSSRIALHMRLGGLVLLLAAALLPSVIGLDDLGAGQPPLTPSVSVLLQAVAGSNSTQTHGSFFAQYTGKEPRADPPSLSPNASACRFAVGSGPSKKCGGTTPPGLTDWKAYGFDGLFVHVDTSQCNFTTMPQYATSLIGNTDEWESTGTSVLLKIEKTFFKVVIIHTTLRGDELLAAANQDKWQVSWIGDAGARQFNFSFVCGGCCVLT